MGKIFLWGYLFPSQDGGGGTEETTGLQQLWAPDWERRYWLMKRDRRQEAVATTIFIGVSGGWGFLC